MTGVVGARMEVVETRRSLFGPDYARLLVVAAVSVGVHLWLIGHTAVTARDSTGFARYALGIQSPESAGPHDPKRTFLDVIKAEKQHPGYPLAVWFTAKFVRRATTLPLPDSTLLATQLVSAIAAVLLVIPTYLIGRMLFGRNVGFAAALLFQVLPVPGRITSDGLTEGAYLLTAMTALALGVRAVRRPGVGGFLLCGLATGLCYLVRWEGLMVGGSVGLVGAWLGLTRRWPRDLAAGRLVALAVGVGLVATPYMVLIGGITNKPTGKEAIQQIIPGRVIGAGEPGRAAVARGPVFATYWTLPEGSGAIRMVEPALSGVAKETLKALHYGAAVLALYGLVVVWRRVAADPGAGLLVVLVGVNVVGLIYQGVRGYTVNDERVYYVSERHVLLIVQVACIFAAAGLVGLGRMLAGEGAGRCLVPAAVLAAIVATALPATLKPLHAHRVAHKYAGEWLRPVLREHGEREEPVVVIDPFEWAAYYSEWTLHQIPPDNRDARIRYTILDAKNHADDHTRLPRMKEARGVASGGELVYWWPTSIPKEQAAAQAQVLVFKTVAPSVNEAEGKPKGYVPPAE